MKNANQVYLPLSSFDRDSINSLSAVDAIDFLLRLRLDKSSHKWHATRYFNHYKSFSNVVDAAVNNSLENIIRTDFIPNLKFPFEFANRYLDDKTNHGTTISDASEVINYLRHSMRGRTDEVFKVLYLNGRNQIIRNDDVSNGTINHAAVYPRNIIYNALKYNASSLILAHNHPSGNARPSKEDISTTNRIRNAANLFDINVLDHVIVAGNKYYSFAMRGEV
jgi:DNA repair protein RadC